MRQKTQTRQVYNEELGCYEWKEVETDRYVFDETDKIAIAREYYERKCPASEIVAKYHISSAVVLYGWLDKYLNEKVCVSLQQETDNDTDMSKRSKQQLEEELKAMKAENKRLQEALELEKLRSRAFDTMIDVAEANFNIPIRKKAGTKQ
jgi:transposase-like protein